MRAYRDAPLVIGYVEIARALVLATSTPPDRGWSGSTSGPRHLMPLANKPILFHNLEALNRAGVLEAMIVVDPATADATREAVGDGSRWGLSVHYATASGRVPVSSGLRAGRDFVGDEPVLVEPADVLLLEHMRTHLRAFAGDGLDALGLRLANVGPTASGGCLLSRRAVALLQRSPDGTSDPVARVRRHGGRVRIQPVDGCLPCEGGVDSLLDANRRLLEGLKAAVEPESRDEASRVQGPVVVHPSARLVRTLVRGPAVIGPGARLSDAYVGPYTSIGGGATIEGTEIEHSIVLEDAELRFVGTRVESSVIGRGARVVRAFELPSALRLAIGDHARVALG